jgi:hypothetical protein
MTIPQFTLLATRLPLFPTVLEISSRLLGSHREF